MYFHSPSRGARHRGDPVTEVWSKAVLNWFEWNLHPMQLTDWLLVEVALLLIGLIQIPSQNPVSTTRLE